MKVDTLLASLMNEPWLIEESWLESVISLIQTNDLVALSKQDKSTPDGGTNSSIQGTVATVPIHGPIFSKPNFITEIFGIGCVSSDIKTDIDTLLADPEVDSIILDIDSPGGAVTGTNQLANVISEGKEIKDITAYVGGVGASAAYWLASGATEIVIDATARVGSIGVVAAYPTSSDDDGYVEIVNTASPNKRPDVSTDEGKKVVTEELNALADVFIGTVAKNRDVSISTVKNDFGKGGVLVGSQAVKAGMADRLGSFEGLINEKFDKGEDSMAKLTLESLKADHKDLYESVIAGVKPDTSELEASHTEDIVAKDTEIAELTAKLEASSTQNNTLEGRMKALEKDATIRAEKDLKVTADNIFTEKLVASSIPERLHAKVSSQVDYNKYVTDGSLDTKAFTEDVDAEVKEWEDTFASDDFVQGVGVSTKQTAPDDVNNDDVSARMLSYLK